MGFSRQEYWKGLQLPPVGDLPDPGIEPVSLMSPALAGRFFISSVTWAHQNHKLTYFLHKTSDFTSIRSQARLRSTSCTKVEYGSSHRPPFMVVSSKFIFPIIFVIPDTQRGPSISTMVITDNTFLTWLHLAGWWEVKERKLSPALFTVTFPLENAQHHQHSPSTKPSLPSPLQDVTPTTNTTSSTTTVSLPHHHPHHYHHCSLYHHYPSSPWQPPSSSSNHLHPSVIAATMASSTFYLPLKIQRECDSGDLFQVYKILFALPCLHLYPSLKAYIPLTNSIFICHSKGSPNVNFFKDISWLLIHNKEKIADINIKWFWNGQVN